MLLSLFQRPLVASPACTSHCDTYSQEGGVIALAPSKGPETWVGSSGGRLSPSYLKLYPEEIEFSENLLSRRLK